MSYSERIKYADFNENTAQIESNWDAVFGDRKIELVFIGQNINKELIMNELNQCLLTDEEVISWKNDLFPQKDQWPVIR